MSCAQFGSIIIHCFASVISGDERRILLFLFFESAVLLVLASLVRFCCVFWRKKKLQGGDLGSFLKKRVRTEPPISLSIVAQSYGFSLTTVPFSAFSPT